MTDPRQSRDDRRRFEALYEEHRQYVFTISRKVLGNDDDAWDIVQEVFLRKWRAFACYDPARASFRAFVSRNTHNLIIEKYHYDQRRPVTAEEIPDDLVPDTLALSENARVCNLQIDECLAHLPSEDRQILIMQVEGYTLEEMALIIGLTIAQVRTRLKRAMQQMQVALRDAGVHA